jgi:hypothetical protein
MSTSAAISTLTSIVHLPEVPPEPLIVACRIRSGVCDAARSGAAKRIQVGQLERSYIRTLNSLESRRRQHPQLGKPDKIIAQWIDPRTGKPWRPEPNDLTPKTEGTNPPTPTKQTPESRQVRRRREREARTWPALSLASMVWAHSGASPHAAGAL